jgi:hypothetical protein
LFWNFISGYFIPEKMCLKTQHCEIAYKKLTEVYAGYVALSGALLVVS